MSVLDVWRVDVAGPPVLLGRGVVLYDNRDITDKILTTVGGWLAEGIEVRADLYHGVLAGVVPEGLPAETGRFMVAGITDQGSVLLPVDPAAEKFGWTLQKPRMLD